MTTAKVEYSHGRYFGYYHLKFYGDDSKRLNNEWNDIEYEKLHTNIRIISEHEASIKNQEAAIAEYKAQLKASKKWYRPWYSKAEKELRNKIVKHMDEIEKLLEKIEELDNDNFYSVSELRVKGEKLLAANSFILTNASSVPVYRGSTRYTEVWEKRS